MTRYKKDDPIRKLTRNERWLFRKFAKHQDTIDQVAAESSDENPPSQRKVLRAINAAEGKPPDEKCVCPDCGAIHRKRQT